VCVFVIKIWLALRYLFLIIILLIPALAEAQLSATGMRAVRYTFYPTSPTVKDPVFIYCNDSGSQKGTLVASSPKGTGPFNFSWFQWSDITKNFSILLKTESDAITSTTDNLGEGGYKVIISGGYDTSLVGWIFIDRPYSSAKLQNRTCDYVALNGEAAVDTFYYRNPVNGAQLKLPNGISFLWSSDPESSIPRPDFLLDPQTFDPPLVDVTYNLQVTDSFGCASESSFFYESIHVKADFTFDPGKGEAPLEVTFTDKSVRASTYKWEFGENKDSISGLASPPPHIYYKPGEYSVKLTVESDMHCIDSLRSENIVVDPSDLDIPNVFTPDGDGLNDYFVVEAPSLRYINVQIFSRSGLKVYSFEGDGESLRNWKGWDGNINNSSREATPGVYFYIIMAIGWDDKVYDGKYDNGKDTRGFVYLFR
jgi:gliding motility-associated-like protein